jgi:adenylosuccinate lyase
MSMQGINAISPVDGRYEKTTAPLQPFFSEKALIRFRVLVEVEYFIALTNIPLEQLKDFPQEKAPALRALYKNFSDADALRVKEIEKTTNHDIKAVEYFIKECFEAMQLDTWKEFIHFGLTSQDVNNTAIPLSLKEGIRDVMIPALEALLGQLKELSVQWLQVPMLAHTHGQPASPTSLGKEVLVFHERLLKQLQQLQALPYPAKFGGATGNFNAHHVAYPEVDWISFANDFTRELGLDRSRVTTQIEHYDNLAAIFDCLKRICTIIIDLNRDFWTYISMEYFRQKVVAGEVGSSAMPHKVNPIDFENSEGNAGVAIALLEHLSVKLPISRLQRDLTDSTVLRTIGMPLAHLLIAVKASLRGLGKLTLNQQAIDHDLEKNMVVVAEAIQTVLRKLNVPNPYEKLKELTRGNQIITRHLLDEFIESLDIPQKEKDALKKITPFNYTGILPDPNL